MNARFLVLLALGAATASDRDLVVLDFQSKGILDKAVLRDLWERTWELASQVPEAGTVPAEETRQMLFEQNILLPQRCDEACYRRLADRLHARRLLVPTVEKIADQLKFGFLLVQGRSGKTLQSASSWSDGRVDRALSAGVSKVLGASDASGAPGFGRPAWTAMGVGIAGLGAALWLGLDQNRSPAVATPRQTSSTNIAGF
jgi:hypothetical protein